MISDFDNDIISCIRLDRILKSAAAAEVPANSDKTTKPEPQTFFDKVRKEWVDDPGLATEFGGDFDKFYAFRVAESRGLIMDANKPAPKTETFAERVRKEWESCPGLSTEFGGSYDRYFAYRDAESRGLIRIKK